MVADWNLMTIYISVDLLYFLQPISAKGNKILAKIMFKIIVFILP